MMKQAGFVEAEMVSETGLNSSPVTRGALFRASKPAVSIHQQMTEAMDTLSKYQEFFEAAYTDGALDRKTKHLIALGASLSAGCDP